MQACEDNFLAMVTEGVVHGVYKIAEVNGRLPLCHKVAYEPWTVVEGPASYAQCLFFGGGGGTRICSGFRPFIRPKMYKTFRKIPLLLLKLLLT